MSMPTLSRRTLFTLAGSAALAGTFGLVKWRFGDPREVVVAILHQRVGYLRVDPSVFNTFAKDYVEYRKTFAKDLKHLSALALPLRFMSPYSWLKQGHPYRRLEDNVVSKFLLSTDFFQNGANDRTLVTYLSFYDPQRVVCRNPFARRD